MKITTTITVEVERTDRTSSVMTERYVHDCGDKHVMERSLRGLDSYVTNGQFIAACLMEGVEIKIQKDSPNPSLGLSYLILGRINRRNK